MSLRSESARPPVGWTPGLVWRGGGGDAVDCAGRGWDVRRGRPRRWKRERDGMQRVFKSGHKSSFGRRSAGRSRCISPDELPSVVTRSRTGSSVCIHCLACPFLATPYPGATLDQLPLRFCHVLLHPSTLAPVIREGKMGWKHFCRGCVVWQRTNAHTTVQTSVGCQSSTEAIDSLAIERPIGSLRAVIRRNEERKPRLGRSTATISRCKEENWGRSPVPENSACDRLKVVDLASGASTEQSPFVGYFSLPRAFFPGGLADRVPLSHSAQEPQGESISTQRRAQL